MHPLFKPALFHKSMTTSDPHHQLHHRKSLAFELRRSVRYVASMKARGFVMTGNRATVAEARAWLAANPPPCARTKCSFSAPLHAAAPLAPSVSDNT
jgi:hypothetical protein